jgi:hypothetical protein
MMRNYNEWDVPLPVVEAAAKAMAKESGPVSLSIIGMREALRVVFERMQIPFPE